MEWLRMTVLYIPASVAVVPISILTGFGIYVTVRGMIRKGEADSPREALLMAAAFVLGFLGGLAALDAAIDYEHTADVCAVSKVVLDPNAQWACPQVLASYWLQWPLASGLLIPAMLFWGVTLFGGREKQTQQQLALNKSKNDSENEEGMIKLGLAEAGNHSSGRIAID